MAKYKAAQPQGESQPNGQVQCCTTTSTELHHIKTSAKPQQTMAQGRRFGCLPLDSSQTDVLLIQWRHTFCSLQLYIHTFNNITAIVLVPHHSYYTPVWISVKFSAIFILENKSWQKLLVLSEFLTVFRENVQMHQSAGYLYQIAFHLPKLRIM
jgi:hypothetical protein